MNTYNTFDVSNSGHIVHEQDDSPVVVTFKDNSFFVWRAEGNDVWHKVHSFVDESVNNNLAKANQIAQKFIEQNYGLD